MNSLQSILITIISALTIVFSNTSLRAQESHKITTEEAKTTVREVIEKIEKLYVIKEKIPRIISALEANLDGGRYSVTEINLFASLLNEDIKELSNDKHMVFEWDPKYSEIISTARDESEESPEEIALYNAEAFADNFGFTSISRLAGNIGYLEFNGFWAETPGAEKKARAAMDLLYGSTAVIIDLRKNGGGHPWMGRIIQSYFFEKPTLVWQFHNRENKEVSEGWTASPVPANNMSGVPLYLLTSGRTASAAEAFAYAAKVFKIGTIVGQRTVGAAHRVSSYSVGKGFIIQISTAAPISPITNSNWEGIGVKPDIETDPADALITAHKHALKTLKSEKSSEEDLLELDWALMEVKAQLTPPQFNESNLIEFSGTYGNRKIFYEKGDLYYQLEDRGTVKLIPLTETVFQHPYRDYYRIRFIYDGSKIIAAEGLYDTGRVVFYGKNER